MFDLDHWREIRSALSANKLRTLLTAFGVFWGLFLLMVMLGSGTGLHNGVTQDFEGATNTFFVWTRSTSKPYRGLPAGRRFELNNQDAVAIRERVPEAAVVCPRNQLGGYRGGNNVVRGEHAGAFSVMGDYPEIRAMEGVRVDRGRFLNRLDLDERRKVAVIGRRAIELLFEPGEDPLGEHIRINGVYFKVVGTFATRDTGDRGDQDAQTIFVPFTTFQHAFNYGDRVGWFAVTSRAGVPASRVEEQVLALLARRHQVAADDRRAFGHFNLEEQFNKVQGLFAGIRTLIWIVGLGTLAAGVIGVSNIMLVIVRERTREIGIRRAVGATPLSVVGQILLEAILLTGVAGYAGMIGGMALIDGVAALLASSGSDTSTFARPDVGLAAALQAFAILIAAGTLAGLIPAQRAVSVRPVEALRAD